MKKYSVLFAIPLALIFAATSYAAYEKPAQSLRKTDAFSGSNVEAAPAYSKVAPGESKPMPRAYDTAPPQISHLIDKNMKIDLKRNGCAECHDKRKAKQKESPPMPDSHYMDAKGKKLRNYAKGRYLCTQCHVEQSNAKPLVSNTFKGTPFKKK